MIAMVDFLPWSGQQTEPFLLMTGLMKHTELSVDEHVTTIENVNVTNIEMLREANDVDDLNDMVQRPLLPLQYSSCS